MNSSPNCSVIVRTAPASSTGSVWRPLFRPWAGRSTADNSESCLGKWIRRNALVDLPMNPYTWYEEDDFDLLGHSRTLTKGVHRL